MSVEALAAGTPVMTTDKTDIWRELLEGGARITNGSVEQISQAIKDVLHMSFSERCELGARGHQYVSQWLNPDVVVKQYEAMYESCLRGK